MKRISYQPNSIAASGTTIVAYPSRTTDPALPIISTDTFPSAEEIEERKWSALLASPESVADMERTKAQIEANLASGRAIEHVPGKSLAELFRS